MKTFLGIDVGSVTTKLALLNESDEVVFASYERTEGDPVGAVQRGLRELEERFGPGVQLGGVGATGSARYLVGAVVGADVVKNEITAQAVAATHFCPDVRTVIEIGGQDSKLIIIRGGMVVDFAMNTVCAAGTGSFLDQQALRLGINVADLGELALSSSRPVRIAATCTVFAESDMIQKQQMGHAREDIVSGLCLALAHNYLSDVGRGKEILSPVLFHGGVAFNGGIVRALEDSLGMAIIVPGRQEAMGAIGMALLVQEEFAGTRELSAFKGFEISETDYRASSFECTDCTRLCEIAELSENGDVVARWGGRCDLWEGAESGEERSV